MAERTGWVSKLLLEWEGQNLRAYEDMLKLNQK